MDTQKPSRGTLVYVCVALVVGIIIGILLPYFFFFPMPRKVSDAQFQAGIEFAKKQVEEQGVGALMGTPRDVNKSILGEVVSVEGGRLVITPRTQAATSTKPVSASEQRIVLLTSTTKIFKMSQRDPKQFQAEMEAFMSSSQKGTPPEPLERSAANIADIKKGELVAVFATDDVSSKSEFTATEVQILQ